MSSPSAPWGWPVPEYKLVQTSSPCGKSASEWWVLDLPDYPGADERTNYLLPPCGKRFVRLREQGRASTCTGRFALSEAHAGRFDLPLVQKPSYNEHREVQRSALDSAPAQVAGRRGFEHADIAFRP